MSAANYPQPDDRPGRELDDAEDEAWEALKQRQIDGVRKLNDPAAPWDLGGICWQILNPGKP